MSQQKKLVAGLIPAVLFTAGLGSGVVNAAADDTPATTPGTDTTETVDPTATTDTTATDPGGQIAGAVEDTPVPETAPVAEEPADAAEPPAELTEAELTPVPEDPAPTPAETDTDPAPAVEPAPEAVAPAAAPTIAEPAEQQPTTGKKKKGEKKAKKDKAGKKDKKAKKKDKQAQEETAADEPAAGTTIPDAGAPTDAGPAVSGLAEIIPGAAPVGVPNFFIDSFRIPPFLLPIYQAAGIQYGIRWEILAAINEIETDYGRNLNVSSAGALGWMQFMPATWAGYGVDANGDGHKDPFNPVDAIFAAARYLKAAGGDTDVRKAIWAYNHADWYVDSVLMRARLISGMPSDLVGSLTGLTQGRFPVADEDASYTGGIDAHAATKRVGAGDNAAMPVEGRADRKGRWIIAKPGTKVIATQDGTVSSIGRTKRLGNYVKLRDLFGNTYTYAHLGSVAKAYPVPKEHDVSRAAIRKELDLPDDDPRPTAAASAGKQSGEAAPAAEATTATTAATSKERLFANPDRQAAAAAGGDEQLVDTGLDPSDSSFDAYFSEAYGLDRSDVDIKTLKVGSKVVSGTILGEIGKTEYGKRPHLRFEVRPAGKDAPRVDPTPILDGWRLLESTSIYRAEGTNPLASTASGADATIGQILLMSKEALQQRVLNDERIEIYECGRDNIRAGIIDRRVLATLEFLAASGLKPTVSSLQCGHGYLTTSGNVSEHTTGTAVDIAAINGTPIIGHQGAGSITDVTIRRLLTLQGSMKPHQIISLMTFDGADNTLSMPDHADHIHIGFHPVAGDAEAGQAESTLKPSQWETLMDRLGSIANPTVSSTPSKYSVEVTKRERTRSGG